MKIVLDNNILFSLMNPISIASYIFFFLKKALDSLSDEDDADFLALALKLNSVIWSNDPHFKQQSLVKVFTTVELFEELLKNEF